MHALKTFFYLPPKKQQQQQQQKLVTSHVKFPCEKGREFNGALSAECDTIYTAELLMQDHLSLKATF